MRYLMTDPSKSSPSDTASEAPVAELVQRATEQITRLVREELTLARDELTAKGKRAGVGAGLLGGGSVLALYGGAVLIAAIVLALGLAIPMWAAAFVVAVILLGAAGLLALRGKKQVNQAMPPVPTWTRDSLRADADAVRGAATEGRRS
jgi:Flp pilus assembly protein TadB